MLVVIIFDGEDSYRGEQRHQRGALSLLLGKAKGENEGRNNEDATPNSEEPSRNTGREPNQNAEKYGHAQIVDIIGGVTKVGLVGAGGMGNVHMRKWAMIPEVEVRLFDVSETRAIEFAERHRISTMESVVALMNWCDVVDICVPTDFHLELAKLSFENRKGVLIEKPLGRTVEECEQIIALAKQHQAFAMPAQVVRYFPEYRKAHDLVKSGRLGSIATARMRRGGKGPASPWFGDIERSGGVILDVAVHEFDWLLWTLGPVKSVYARSAKCDRPELEGAQDYALVMLEFENGCIGHVESTWMDPGGFRTTLEVCGSAGMIEHDSRQIQSVRRVDATGATAVSNELDPTDDPYYQQIKAFYDAFTTRQSPPVSLEEGAAAVRLAVAALESAQSGRIISLT